MRLSVYDYHELLSSKVGFNNLCVSSAHDPKATKAMEKMGPATVFIMNLQFSQAIIQLTPRKKPVGE